jgi:hypothetical protein
MCEEPRISRRRGNLLGTRGCCKSGDCFVGLTASSHACLRTVQAMTLLMRIIYNRFTMTKKYRKQRQLTPAWLDTLIGGLEVLAAIGGIFGAIYALISLFEMFSK